MRIALPASALTLLVTVAMFAISVWLYLDAGETVQSYAVIAVWLSYSSIGALLATRRPENPIGPLLLVGGLAGQIQGLSDAYGRMRSAFATELVDVWLWPLANNVWVVMFLMLSIVLVLFPDGRLPSRRWRAVPYLAAVLVATGLLTSGGDSVVPLIPLILGRELGGTAIEIGQGVTGIGQMLLFILGALSLAVRMRRSNGVERQQVKWVAYAAGLFAFVFVFTAVAFFSPLRALDPGAEIPPAMFAGIPFLAALILIPVSIAIAIFRFRLYEIDVLINRTLVYGALTAILGASYVLFVVLFQTILRPVTGGSEISVAASTLAAVALFQPLQRRIQRAVDRRFYRSRYDAQRTLDAFAARLRDEVDLGALEEEIVGVIERTVRPAHARLWLRPGSGRS